MSNVLEEGRTAQEALGKEEGEETCQRFRKQQKVSIKRAKFSLIVFLFELHLSPVFRISYLHIVYTQRVLAVSHTFCYWIVTLGKENIVMSKVIGGFDISTLVALLMCSFSTDTVTVHTR